MYNVGLNELPQYPHPNKSNLPSRGQTQRRGHTKPQTGQDEGIINVLQAIRTLMIVCRPV